MSGPRIKDVPIRALRKLGARPMTPWEHRDASAVPVPRAILGPSEHWSNSYYINNRYSVQVSVVHTELGEVTHLWIRAHDGSMPRSWSDLQRIKNQLAGFERLAVEVFPPDSELVDFANIAHLWVYPSGCALPFGLGRR